MYLVMTSSGKGGKDAAAKEANERLDIMMGNRMLIVLELGETTQVSKKVVYSK